MTHAADAHTTLLPEPKAHPMPRVVRNEFGSQLFVDGGPFLSLGGELHNSSPSSPAYMAPIWDRLAENGVRSVIGAASWQLVEPVEGTFDFTAVDDQVQKARARGIRLILIWFGSYKNAESSYAPTWVRRNEDRFPRAERDQSRLLTGRFSLDGPILSVFGENLVEADGRAFAALMRHLRETDPDRTVIAVQVQNEVGLLGDSRDRSSLAETAWAAPVPAELLRGLSDRENALSPWLRDIRRRAGSRDSGTWAEVFGTGPDADEIFMSWAFSRFVDRVARAGLAEYPLPVYTNAWLGPQPNADVPGRYPSGGPVSRMIDVWQIGAPSLDFLAPDIYIEDFAGTLRAYDVAGNGIFVPEARPDPGLAFVAVGAYRAMGFHPFGIDAVLDHRDLFQAFSAMDRMAHVITRAQATGSIHGFRLVTGEQEVIELGGYTVTVSGPLDTRGMFGAGTGEEAAVLTGYGLIVHVADDEFLVLARGASVRFSRSDAVVELDTLTEGEYVGGRWVPGRILNGDERYFMFPKDDLRIVRIELLRRAANDGFAHFYPYGVPG
ncbi:MAG: glycoside hydrolase [Microbacterium sp.]|nr:glycoside hydrolase [Microbacterium sp.]